MVPRKLDIFMPSSIDHHLTRVLRLLLLLDSGSRFNTAQMADQLGVTRRTIFRDIQLLRQCGVPVVFDERRGSYSLQATVVSARPHFSTDEALILAMAASVTVLRVEGVLRGTLEDTIAKFLQCLPVSVREEVASVLRSCVWDTADTPPPLVLTEPLRTVLESMRLRQHVRVDLATSGGPGLQGTKIAPYRLVATPTGWLLVGHSSWHRETRSFDVKSIQRAEVVDELFIEPPRFRIASASTYFLETRR